MRIKYRRPNDDEWRYVQFPDEYYVSYGQIVPIPRHVRRNMVMEHHGFALRIYQDSARKRCVFIDVAQPHWYVDDENIMIQEEVVEVAEDGNVWTGEGVDRAIVVEDF